MNKIQLFSILFIALLSCNNNNKTGQKDKIAMVFDKELSINDVKEIIPREMSIRDSIDYTQSFINKWIRKQLILKKAELNLSENELSDIQKQIEEYRASLFIFKYEQKYIQQHLDTSINEEDIKKFYYLHADEFKLQKNVVKVLFIKILLDDANKELKDWLIRYNKHDSVKINNYCNSNAVIHENFNNNWLYFDEITNMLPRKISDEEKMLKSSNLIEDKDTLFQYFVLIRDYRMKTETSPLKFVRNNIKTILLNKRRYELVCDLENSLYQDGVKYNHFKIFELDTLNE